MEDKKIATEIIEARIIDRYPNSYKVELRNGRCPWLPFGIIHNHDEIHPSDTELFQEFEVSWWWCEKNV